MSTTISICNHKGGVGKTTTVVNLSAALAQLGKRVLVIDMDPQGNATLVLYPGNPFQTEQLAASLFRNPESSMYTVQQPSREKNVSIIPTNINMLLLEKEIMGTYKMIAGLKEKFDEETHAEFDFVLIDCPPNLGSFVTNALTISDYYIIPVGAEDFFAISGLENILNHANDIKRGENKKLELMGLLLTLFDGRTSVSKGLKVEVTNFVTNRYGPDKIFKTIINRNTELNQAVIRRKTIFQHDRHASGAKDYLSLAKEVVEYVETRGNAKAPASVAVHA